MSICVILSHWLGEDNVRNKLCIGGGDGSCEREDLGLYIASFLVFYKELASKLDYIESIKTISHMRASPSGQ